MNVALQGQVRNRARVDTDGSKEDWMTKNVTAVAAAPSSEQAAVRLARASGAPSRR